MENCKKYLMICFAGAVGYSLIEILWRGYTHWTMAVTGGIGFLALYLLEQRLSRRPLWQKAAAGALLITAVELVAGLIINIGFGLDVWDYSRVPGNFLGQICLSYSLLWFLLCLMVISLMTFFRRWVPTKN